MAEDDYGYYLEIRDFWFIAHFDDYHEIDSLSKSVKPFLKSHELGTFEAPGFSYRRYYGLFWNGATPSVDAINMLLREFKIKLAENDISYPSDSKKGISSIQ